MHQSEILETSIGILIDDWLWSDWGYYKKRVGLLSNWSFPFFYWGGSAQVLTRQH